MNRGISFIVQAALIAALYTALTLMFIPISFGHNIFQFRISEALTVLPALVPSSIPGLFTGCLISNLIGGFGPIDIIFGSIATLIAAVFSRLLRKYPFLVPLPPVVFNALIVGSYLKFLYIKDVPLLASIGWVALGQMLACYALGLPLLCLLKKSKWFSNIEKY
ncbi:MAG TPA: QueT transporter family protein [Clostridia bacterium]